MPPTPPGNSELVHIEIFRLWSAPAVRLGIECGKLAAAVAGPARATAINSLRQWLQIAHFEHLDRPA
jgi:hypothetical protein